MYKKLGIVFIIIGISITIYFMSYFGISTYISNVVTFILGIVSIFIYRYFNRAIIKTELDNIDKIIKGIKIKEYKEFEFLDMEISKNNIDTSNVVDFSELQNTLNNLKEELEDIPNTMALHYEDLGTINSVNDLLNRNDIQREQDEKKKNKIIKKLNKLKERKKLLDKNIPITQKKVEELQNTLSCFRANLTLTNCGYTNIAIRKHALLRIYGNSTAYMDIKMKMCNFEKCELKAQSTIVIIFESSEIQSFLGEDRKFANKFWNQNINARLFFEDINNIIYTSNEMLFADELYQKVAYDKLSAEATKMIKVKM
jgi:predicted RNase H-like nuclease (RuvC/YqgF family)